MALRGTPCRPFAKSAAVRGNKLRYLAVGPASRVHGFYREAKWVSTRMLKV